MAGKVKKIMEPGDNIAPEVQKRQIELLSRLLRELEAEIGTRDLANLVLGALGSSVKSFKAENLTEFCKQFRSLTYVLSSTEPKFGILNYHFANLRDRFIDIFGKNKHYKDKTCPKRKNWRNIALKAIRSIFKDAKGERRDLLKNAEKLKVEGKTILIHDHSHTVHDVLEYLKKQGRNFQVVIAEQDFEKTHGNIERMDELGIPFQVIPAYMLSHVHDQIDMLFFGGLTLKDTMNFVMDPGTHGIISEFHVESIPVYMFIETTKFSLWKSKKRGEIFMRKHCKKHHQKEIEYDRIKYSHDRVPLAFFKKVITNEGVFTAPKLESLYLERYEQYGLKEE